jgi:deoxycytidylate deaminase
MFCLEQTTELVDSGQRARRLTVIPKLLKTALKTANESTYPGYKLGAVISTKYKGGIVSSGVNKEKSSPMQSKYSPIYFSENGFVKPKSIHAEINAISNMKASRKNGSYIFVARVNKDGNFANSRPCSGCFRAIKDAGISYMIYHKDGYFYKEKV